MQQGVALCRSCGVLKPLKDVVNTPSLSEAELANPPAGCKVEQFGTAEEYTVSLRSVGGAIGAMLAALFWNGIVSVFVLIAVAGTWPHVFGPLPAWFPTPGNISMPAGMAAFLWVFLLPFMTIGAVLLWAIPLGLWGTLTVRIEDATARISTGVGALAWHRRFDPRAVTSVRLGETAYQVNERAKPLIVLNADRALKFGTALREDQRTWLAAALAARLVRA